MNPPNALRRGLLMLGLSQAAWGNPTPGTAPQKLALPVKTLVFPRDFGAHPDFGIEWWYITGHANAGARTFGFQITFFRSRVAATQAMRSRFAAKQLIFAHAAVTDVQGKKLWHDQRIARSSGLPHDLATASETDTLLRLNDWSLSRNTNRYQATIPAKDFALDLEFTETQALILQGQQGLSRKGPEPEQASYYYSKPQLAVRGQITLQGQAFKFNQAGLLKTGLSQGAAWLDHEWSQSLLHPSAVGWDWIGMNLFDGSALTAFRLRTASGGSVWAGGSFRDGSGMRDFRTDEVIFTPLQSWKSPQSGTSYPVQWAVQTPKGTFTVKALLDNQELDSRNSTGAIYWEGLSDLFNDQGQRVGRGYLEMTGYGAPLRL
jgi:predicted secreted hydrolase